MAWLAARDAAYAAGRAAAPDPVEVPLPAADGLTLAAATDDADPAAGLPNVQCGRLRGQR